MKYKSREYLDAEAYWLSKHTDKKKGDFFALNRYYESLGVSDSNWAYYD